MKEIAAQIDFKDSDLENFELDGGELAVYFQSWDEKNITILFFDVLQFTYRPGDVIDGAYEEDEKADFFIIFAWRAFPKIIVNTEKEGTR